MNKTYVDPRCCTCGDPVDLFCPNGHGYVSEPLEGFRRSAVAEAEDPESWIDNISGRLEKYGNLDPALTEMLQERAHELVSATLSLTNLRKELELLKLKPEIPTTYLYQIAMLKNQIMDLKSALKRQ